MSELQRLTDDTRTDIISFAKERYTDDPDIAELGDYLPFLTYFGEERWAGEQVEQSRSAINRSARPSDREDTLVGLLEYYELTGDESALALSENYFDYLLSTFLRDSRIVTPCLNRVARKAEYARYNHHSAVVRAVMRLADVGLSLVSDRQIPPYQALPRNGVFIELLVDLYEITGERCWLKSAQTIADAWLETPTFRQYGLFPRPNILFWREPMEVKIFKGNTGVVNGLLALCRVGAGQQYADAVARWCDAVYDRCVNSTVYGQYRLATGDRYRPELLFSFAYLDVLCYADVVTDTDGYLEKARSVADFWLTRQSDIGLFPFRPSSDHSFQDAMTDFSISLLRLSERTDDPTYGRAARKGIEALFRYHRFPLWVDVETGDPIDDEIQPRYVTLMSKAIIALEVDSIFDDVSTFKLLRDR